jgi:hypothetical protein
VYQTRHGQQVVRQYLTGNIETIVWCHIRRGVDNEICYLLGRFDVLIVHGTDRLVILFQDLRHGATALGAIAIHASDQSNVRRGILKSTRQWIEPSIDTSQIRIGNVAATQETSATYHKYF